MSDYRKVEPSEQVTVLVDGVRRRGILQAWQRTDDGPWRGYVASRGEEPGQNYLGWYPADVIERVDEG